MEKDVQISMKRPCGNKDGWKFLDSNVTMTVREWVNFLYDRLNGDFMDITVIHYTSGVEYIQIYYQREGYRPEMNEFKPVSEKKVVSIIWKYSQIRYSGCWTFEFLLER